MPHCIVKQPNGNFAIWSTISDCFTVFDISPDEIIEESILDQPSPVYNRDELERSIRMELEHIAEIGYGWDWSNDWNDAVRWLEDQHNTEQLKIIDDLSLPRRMKREHTPLQVSKYWHMYWRNKSAMLSYEIRRIKDHLQKRHK